MRKTYCLEVFVLLFSRLWILSWDELCLRTVTCMSAFSVPLRVWFGSIEKILDLGLLSLWSCFWSQGSLACLVDQAHQTNNPEIKQAWGIREKISTHWNLKTFPFKPVVFLDTLLLLNDTVTHWLVWQWQYDAKQNESPFFCLKKMVMQPFSNATGYLLLTSPCLRRPHCRTLILLDWTAPSPPLVKEGSREGREEAWACVAREAGTQTEGNKTSWLSLQKVSGFSWHISWVLSFLRSLSIKAWHGAWRCLKCHLQINIIV